ncbi:hypothetical protein EC957_010947 [Mortierella hygrophila]|uniref:Uncharacterized protein n=1 Tax=Mortierella hygrophila TaxID=979708 RepID=A0A9P6F996_9FUNG|nr:hypothetical protein EC957_010947 [Mortierella hygrophila]
MRSRMTVITPSTNLNLCLMYDRTLDGQTQAMLQSHTESSADSMDLRNFEDVLGTARCGRKLQTNNLLLAVNKQLLRIEGSQASNRSHQRHSGYSLNASTVSSPGSDENSKPSPPSLPLLQKHQEVQVPLAQPTTLMKKLTQGWRSSENTSLQSVNDTTSRQTKDRI